MRRARTNDYSSVRWLVAGRHQSHSQNKKNKSKERKAMK
jgi:hypothetical protein